MAIRIILRNDTAAGWTTTNPVLAQGEMGIERDTKLQKVGDGTTAWSALPYSNASGTGTGIAFNAAIRLDSIKDMGLVTQTGAITFSYDSLGAVPGGQTTLSLIANGAAINMGPFIKLPTYGDSPSTVAGDKNEFVFFKTSGGTYYSVAVFPSATDVVAPTATTAIVQNTNASRIVLTLSEPINTTLLPVAAAFAVSSGHAVSSLTAIDSTNLGINVATPFVAGETKTLSYTQPGSGNKLQDVAGNFLATFTGKAITDNVIAAPIFSAQAMPGVTQGAISSYTFVASDTTSFAITSGSVPPGMSLNTSTGVVSGTPTTVGSSTFVVTATGPGGSTASSSQTVATAASGGSTGRIDTFNRADANTTAGPSDGLTPDYIIAPGATDLLFIRSNAAAASPFEGGYYGNILTNVKAGGDMTVECLSIIDSAGGSLQSGTFVILFRYLDNSNYWRCVFTVDGVAAFDVFVAGVQYGQGYGTSFNPAQSLSAKIICLGDDITLQTNVNGAGYTTVLTKNQPAGNGQRGAGFGIIGAGTSNYPRFNNFQVS